MKLAMSVPERPGWIFVVPGVDFMGLILALVMLTGVVQKETFIEVSLPTSEFRGSRLGDESPVVVIVKHRAAGSSFYINRQPVEREGLEGAIMEAAESQATSLVVVKMDQEATVALQQEVVDLCRRLGFRCQLAVRTSEIGAP
ncbi:MAG: ExbD/TolR family protein [Verrucomicrobiaceae bacterium]